MNPGHLLYLVFNPGVRHTGSWGGISRRELDSLEQQLNSHSNTVCLAGRNLINSAGNLADLIGGDRTCSVPSGNVLQQIRIVLLQIIYLSIDSYSSEENRMPMQVKELMEFIEEHLYENISIDKLTACSGLSRSRIFTLFSRYVGQSPVEYSSYLQCLKAAEILQTSPVSITETAYKFGFCSSQYFAQVFKKFMGLSPGDYSGLKKK